MNIEQKLKLSQQTDYIYFFREGIFAQLYGVSLYLAVTRLNLDLNLCLYKYKSLSNQKILRAGLPTKKLESLLPNGLANCQFGYSYKNLWHVDRNSYNRWYKKNTSELLSINCKNKHSKDFLSKELIPLWLTEEERQFLLNWQKDKYGQSTEQQFIDTLQRKIVSSYA
ncbi:MULTISPECIES: hypothetical protein [unclassified Gilliamella]|uniref:hypothetical protein n=1 Tax=unclassified Gilliamella TaxID=2685620 RepID=UPI0018DC2D2C|nr:MULTISPECIES: hypothetical protein [unclassified Gilliamella]MBI0154612.1 hypothetical protein [Gilliamella sp. W8128]MBI0157459.1 hypothetical protein [Gilliamella sp. M0364]